MSFFHFSQNNSGGSFELNELRGITHHVIIEADSANHANFLAEEIGIYFDGCESDQDCPCCGDRWYRAADYEAQSEPKVYQHPAHDYDAGSWMPPGKEICVHYADGRKLWYGVQEKRKRA